LSSEPCEGCSFQVSVFDIPENLLPSFYEREDEFKIISVEFEESSGARGTALMCTKWTDEEYVAARFEIRDTKTIYILITENYQRSRNI